MMHLRLRQFRKRLGLSQKDFAARIHLSQVFLSRLECGTYPISEATMYLFNKEYSMNLEWLKTGQGEMISEFQFIFFSEYARMKSLDHFESALIREFLFLDKESKSRIMAHAMLSNAN